jgi:hypothetical protein
MNICRQFTASIIQFCEGMRQGTQDCGAFVHMYVFMYDLYALNAYMFVNLYMHIFVFAMYVCMYQDEEHARQRPESSKPREEEPWELNTLQAKAIFRGINTSESEFVEMVQYYILLYSYSFRCTHHMLGPDSEAFQ